MTPDDHAHAAANLMQGEKTGAPIIGQEGRKYEWRFGHSI